MNDEKHILAVRDIVIKKSRGKEGKSLSLAGMFHLLWANLAEICGEKSFLGWEMW